jgi:hypothetical protein
MKKKGISDLPEKNNKPDRSFLGSIDAESIYFVKGDNGTHVAGILLMLAS